MRERYRLFALAVGMLLCVVAPAALKTSAAANGAGESAPANVTGSAGIEVQVLAFLPLGRAATGLADLGERSDVTEIVVTLTELPPDLLSPSLIAEINEGTCLDLKKPGLVRASGETTAAYSLTPSVSSLRSFAAVLPASLAALRSSAHAITVRNGPELGIADVTCVDVL